MHILSRWYQHTTISSLCPWPVSSMQKPSGEHIPRTGETVRSLIDRVHLTGQLEVMSSHWPPPPEIFWKYNFPLLFTIHYGDHYEQNVSVRFLITYTWKFPCIPLKFLILETEKKNSFHVFLLIPKKYLI